MGLSGVELATKVIPLALAFIMFGLGLSLTTEDFKRVARFPKPILIGLAAQMLLLPSVAFLLCKLFELPAELAIGLMLLAASPGGTTANVFSHLSDGDVALNITLTAINSVLAAVTLPLFVGLSIAHFAGSRQDIGFQFVKAVEVFAIVLVPVSIGLLVHSKSRKFAKKMDKPVRIFSIVFLVTLVVSAFAQEWDNVSQYFSQLGSVVICFNLISLATGYLLPRWFQVGRKQATAVAMEIGVHNSTLAIYIALSVIGNYGIAMPAALYSMVMFLTAGVFAYVMKTQLKGLAPTSP